MNCDNDFYIHYDRTFAKVKPFCESNNTHYKVYLHENEVRLLKHIEKDGTVHWYETDKGESELAVQLGRLIEEQQKEHLQ